MELSGRQRKVSNPSVSSLPPSSTFRRLPNISRGPFKRDKTSDSPQEDNKTLLSIERPIGAHHRGATFPSLAVDEIVNPTALLPSLSETQPSTSGSVSNLSHFLYPSPRTSSLPSSPANPSTDTSSYSGPLTPRVASSSSNPLGPTHKDNMTQTMSMTSGPPDFDLEPITYPAHLAVTKRPDPPTVPPSGRSRENNQIPRSAIIAPAILTEQTPMIKSRRQPSSPAGPHSPLIPDEGRDRLGRPAAQATPDSNAVSFETAPQGSSSRKASTDITATTVGSSRPEREETEVGTDDTARRRVATEGTSRHPATHVKQSSTGASTVKERGEHRRPSGKASRTNRVLTPKLPRAGSVPRAPTSSMYFSTLPVHGRPPEQALRAHTGTLVGDRIWFFGGVDGKNCWRGVAFFDTETLLWCTVETFGEQLPPLRAHTTTLVGKVLYIFGGGDGPTYSNDVWTFDTVSHRFSKPKIDTSQGTPPPRRAHTTILYRQHLVVFGGGNGQAALNDIWALDVSDPATLGWQEWKTKGDVPQKKGYHTANLIGDKMVVFGGSDGHASFADVHVLNLKTLQWTLVATEIKHNRLSHTSTQVGSYLFVIGGHNGQTYAQDVLLFNLVTLQWESKSCAGVPPPGRGYHVALLHDARIFISGGYNGVSVFDDLWVLDLGAGSYLPQVTTFDIDEMNASVRRGSA